MLYEEKYTYLLYQVIRAWHLFFFLFFFYFFFLFIFIYYCHTTYKDIQYTTLLTLLTLLTTQYYIRFSFPFVPTVREKKKKEREETTYYICT